MPIGWQDILALTVVSAATGYLVRQAWLVVRRRKAGACGGGCPTCPSGKPLPEGPIVTIDALERSARQR
jgi:hypothetical protein